MSVLHAGPASRSVAFHCLASSRGLVAETPPDAGARGRDRTGDLPPSRPCERTSRAPLSFRMLTFLTLLLGIVAGPREIEVSAPADTAAVEIFLDGESVARRTRSPWTFVVDLGPAPAPHHLDAVARDARGVEIGRARQRVNLPKPEAESVLALLPGTGGKGRIATLRWEGAVGNPRSVALSFDGKPLAAPDPERIELPAFVPERLHFLRAALEFERGARAEAEITFGGRDRGEADRVLTAIPLRVPGGTPAEAMSGWLLADGERLRVVATESGDASIVFVLDADGPSAFRELADWSVLPTRAGMFFSQPEVRMLLAYGTNESGARAAYDVFPRLVPRAPGEGPPPRPRGRLSARGGISLSAHGGRRDRGGSPRGVVVPSARRRRRPDRESRRERAFRRSGPLVPRGPRRPRRRLDRRLGGA